VIKVHHCEAILYNIVNKKLYNDLDTNTFDCIPNGLSLIYLLIVRTNEILKRYLEEEYKTVQEEIWEYIQEKLNIENFGDFLKEFDIKVNKLPKKWKNEDDYIKVFGLLSNIRNSISHWRYEIDVDSTITMKDRPFGKEDNFHIKIKYNQLLNLAMNTVSLIHDYLKLNKKIN
jgi:hypothetical protein